MEKYAVMKELKCAECGEVIILPNNASELVIDMEKKAHVLVGHEHQWQEVIDGEKES